MRLAIDCRFSQKSGIGTYIDNVVDCLLTAYPDNQYLIICNRDSRFKQIDNVKIIETDIQPFSVKELIQFPVNEINECNAFFTPYINIPGRIKIPIYSVIHDVVFLDVDGLVSSIGRMVRKFYYKRAIKLSEKILTVSQFSKYRILHHFPTQKEIIVAYNGVPNTVINYNGNSIGKKDYFLFVGNIKKHKGLHTLVKAYKKAKENGLSSKLLIVGNNEKFRTSDDELTSLINNIQGIEFTGWVSDEKLLQLISESKALVQPSLYEGFGLPPLEALYLGTDVILSDIQVFKELYGDLPVTFFNVGNIDDLTNAMLNFESKNHIDISKDMLNKKFSYRDVVDSIFHYVV
ncbi:MAG: glycosyltransferase family 4 protein [Bacteroidales bacterium]|nr:glycosyltransferase family 4 protein [Bacteroidales bacterium]